MYTLSAPFLGTNEVFLRQRKKLARKVILRLFGTLAIAYELIDRKIEDIAMKGEEAGEMLDPALAYSESLHIHPEKLMTEALEAAR
jgi:hypothetical protein